MNSTTKCNKTLVYHKICHFTNCLWTFSSLVSLVVDTPLFNALLVLCFAKIKFYNCDMHKRNELLLEKRVQMKFLYEQGKSQVEISKTVKCSL